MARIRLHPDPAAIRLDDPLANRQADSGSRIILPVQPLEDPEDLLRVFRLDSDAVVLHRKEPIPVAAARAEMWMRGGSSLRYLIALPTRFCNSCTSRISCA